MDNHHHHHHDDHDHNPVHVKRENHPRDLLQRFNMSSGGGGDDNTQIQQSQHEVHHHHNQQHHNLYHRQQQQQEEEKHDEEEEEIELNLGLSLGGRFGVDKHANKNKKLLRSSSVVGTMLLPREDEAAASLSPMMAAAPHLALTRTSSLPTETEEEWRKRKELQMLRRLEAKRRRSEKQRVSKMEREGSAGGGLEEVESAGAATMGLNRFGGGSSTVAPPPFGLPSWGLGSKQAVLGDVLGKGKVSGVGFQGLFAQPSSQGSADSLGGSSSSMSEMESKPFLGSSSCGEARSPGSNQSLQEQGSQDAIGSSGTKTNENMTITSRAEVENPSKRPHPAQNMGREIGTNSVEDMPCVFTKGDGPNGRRIEGILYKYGRGEEVRIMCVCHGKFLSPAEFVKHAGGGDVAHPLRHIVVNPSAAPFL